MLLKPLNPLMEQAKKTAKEAMGKGLDELEIEGAKGFFLKKKLGKDRRFLPVGKVSDEEGNSYYVGHYV